MKDEGSRETRNSYFNGRLNHLRMLFMYMHINIQSVHKKVATIQFQINTLIKGKL